MVALLRRLATGAVDASLEAELDQILAGPSYQAMFRHYNRSWRPDHLPIPTFKQMILHANDSTRVVENRRANQMVGYWRDAFSSLDRVHEDVHRIEVLVKEGLVDEALVEAGPLPSPASGSASPAQWRSSSDLTQLEAQHRFDL